MAAPFRYVGTRRRTKEDPRFVAGRGRYVADIHLPGMKHVALVASPHPSARIVSLRADAALALPGVLYVLTGEEFCAATPNVSIGTVALRPQAARNASRSSAAANSSSIGPHAKRRR